MSVETCSRVVVHAIWNAVEGWQPFHNFLTIMVAAAKWQASTIPGGMPVVGISDLSASRQRISDLSYRQQASTI